MTAVWDLFAHHQPRAALWVLIQYDIYGREQDVEQLQVGDLSFDGSRLALLLGASVRGETTKTGANQGVVVRRGFVAEGLMAAANAAKRRRPAGGQPHQP